MHMKGLINVIDRGTVEYVQGNCGLFMKAVTAQMTGVFEGSRAPHESIQRVSGRSVKESVHGVQVTVPCGVLPARMQGLIQPSVCGRRLDQALHPGWQHVPHKPM